MKSANKSFIKSNELLTGTVYESVTAHDSFTHIKSYFRDAWYNFIVPNGSVDNFNWEKSQKVINREQKKGFALSYYIEEKLLPEYRKRLSKHEDFGSEFYMFYKNKLTKKVPGELVDVNDNSVEKYVEMAKICFPDWENNEKYSRYFYDKQKQPSDDLSIVNYLYRVKGVDVGFASIIASNKHSLSYLHNMGVLPKYRRKGYFTDITKLLSNYSISKGIEESYALVEGGEASYHGFKKLGFTTKGKYYLFGTKKQSESTE